MIRFILLAVLLVRHQALTQFLSISVDPSVSKICDDIVISDMYRYVLFKIDNTATVVVDETGDRSKTYDDFLERMKELEASRESRYAIFNFDFQHEGSRIQRTAFIFWCPNSASMQTKMAYFTSKATVIKALPVLDLQLEGNKIHDLDFQTIKEEVITAKNMFL